MYGHLRKDTKVPLGNIPYLLHLKCVLNQQQVTTVQLIRLISEGKKTPKTTQCKYESGALQTELPHCSQLVVDGYKLCRHSKTCQAHHQLHGDFIKGKTIWSVGYRKKFPFPQINCSSSGWKAGEGALGKRHM